MKIEDLGYNEFFESNRNALKLADFSVARVTAEYRGAYKVKNEKGEFLAKVTGKRMFGAIDREDYPAVGDWVAIEELGESRAVIRGVLPRSSIIKRRYGENNKFAEKDEVQIIATNIDVAFIVESVDRDYNLNRLERYFAIAESGGSKSAVILNKIDLISKKELDEKLSNIKSRFPDMEVIPTSMVSSNGLEKLRQYIKQGKTHCFLGSSGVGKSSLINELLGGNVIRTESISSYSGRGRHTTTNRQMYFLENGGIVIDNPGIREVGMTDVGKGIEVLFEEITDLAKECKYADCTHVHEPGCEVLVALKSGKLDRGKYSNYINLKKEVEYFELNGSQKRNKERQFGKFISKAQKEIKKYKS